MEVILPFAVMVIAISASGVMSPGPLFTANIVYGLKEGKIAGLKIAMGHTVVEFPLIVFLGLGTISLETFPEYRILITVIGAIGLFVFAGLQIKSIFGKDFRNKTNSNKNSFLAGIFLSALNPFFIIWWLTIGIVLITESIALWGFSGILILFIFHIWMDYVWLFAVAGFASKAKNVLSNNNYKILIVGLSIILVYFGVQFLLQI
jgi:threonine/homoserine/homoserine lactone efflux protein